MNECESCFNTTLSDCLTGFTIAGGFVIGDVYVWRITSKFDKKYSAMVVADSNGNIFVDALDLPEGFLNPFQKEFLLQVYDSIGRPVDIAICQIYKCIKIKVEKNSGDSITTTIGNCESTVGGVNVENEFVFNEVPAGAINGINATFTTTNNFIPGSLEVFLNGMIQKIVDDYNTVGNNILMLVASPLPSEDILVNYLKL